MTVRFRSIDYCISVCFFTCVKECKISPLNNASHDVLVSDLSLHRAFVFIWRFPASTPHLGHQVHEALHGGDDVEGRGQGGARLKVTDPQLCSRKLPFTATENEMNSHSRRRERIVWIKFWVEAKQVVKVAVLIKTFLFSFKVLRRNVYDCTAAGKGKSDWNAFD